ncbi:MAG TPA: hypothetical protein VMV32_00950 [Ignavibacteriaceae bacterium]|nr:hypothetical protein [Ignavibacteriaceae bacterium]
MKLDKYRFDDQTGEVFRFSEDANCYFFCGHRNGLSKKEFIRRYEFNNQY